MMKESYVKPTVKSEILKAEVLNNWGSGCNSDGRGDWVGGFWWWCK